MQRDCGHRLRGEVDRERCDAQQVPVGRGRDHADDDHRADRERGQRGIRGRCSPQPNEETRNHQQEHQQQPDAGQIGRAQLICEGRSEGSLQFSPGLVQTGVGVLGCQRAGQHQLQQHHAADEGDVRRRDLPAVSTPPATAQIEQLRHPNRGHDGETFAAHVEHVRGRHAEDDQLPASGQVEWLVVTQPIEPPQRERERGHVRELADDLVGVEQVGKGGSHRGHCRKREPLAHPAANHGVEAPQEPDQACHLEQLEFRIVETEQSIERGEEQREAPRVHVGAESGFRRVVHVEVVVRDDLPDVAVEEALRLAQVQREVVAPRVTVAVHADGAACDEHTECDERPTLTQPRPNVRPPFVRNHACDYGANMDLVPLTPDQW